MHQRFSLVQIYTKITQVSYVSNELQLIATWKLYSGWIFLRHVLTKVWLWKIWESIKKCCKKDCDNDSLWYFYKALPSLVVLFYKENNMIWGSWDSSLNCFILKQKQKKTCASNEKLEIKSVFKFHIMKEQCPIS